MGRNTKKSASAKSVEAAKNEVINNETVVETPKSEVTSEVPAETPKKERVKLRYRITQMSKHPFSFEMSDETNMSTLSLINLARKMGYSVGGQLRKYAENALAFKAKHGDKYISGFRPKSVFKVEVSVNGISVISALATKGLDAIRILDGKGRIVSPELLADKFNLIALSVEAFAGMWNALKDENEANDLLASIENEGTKGLLDSLQALEATTL